MIRLDRDAERRSGKGRLERHVIAGRSLLKAWSLEDIGTFFFIERGFCWGSLCNEGLRLTNTTLAGWGRGEGVFSGSAVRVAVMNYMYGIYRMKKMSFSVPRFGS
jgi:hypothetical protein